MADLDRSSPFDVTVFESILFIEFILCLIPRLLFIGTQKAWKKMRDRGGSCAQMCPTQKSVPDYTSGSQWGCADPLVSS